MLELKWIFDISKFNFWFINEKVGYLLKVIYVVRVRIVKFGFLTFCLVYLGRFVFFICCSWVGGFLGY